METSDPANHPHSRAGRRLAWLAVIGLIIGLTAFYHALTTRDTAIVQSIQENGRTMVVLQRDRSGHFLAEGQINGHAVLFLVDTGATDVAISEKMARSIGLEFGPRVAVMTAAGPSVAWRTRLNEVSLGAFALKNVRATITPGLGNNALLGMSFLQYFNLRQEGDLLVLESAEGTEPGKN